MVRSITQDLHPDKNWGLYERLTRKAECSVDQQKVESDGKPSGGPDEMLAALISSVVANASLVVTEQQQQLQSASPSLNANHGWVSTATAAAAAEGLMTQQHGLHAGNGGTGTGLSQRVPYPRAGTILFQSKMHDAPSCSKEGADRLIGR